MRTRTEKTSTFDTFASLAEDLLKSWNSQCEPPKVYIAGRRVHHGTIGTMLTAAGIASLIASVLSENDRTKYVAGELSQIFCGVGLPLVQDDWHDRKEWFKFERQEDPSGGQTDFGQSGCYSGYV